MHYQFETIHPFLDGNGRIGRVVINLLLMERGRLDHPLHYVSHYFETHRSQYYSALQGVMERSDIETWIRFFFVATHAQARDAVARSHRIVTVRGTYLTEAHRGRSGMPKLVDLILENPFVTVKHFADASGLTLEGARNIIKKAVSLGWLRSVGTRGRGGREYW